ncbi:MAG: efflux RND transporter periplasmic adaptor subunit [Holosporales bacterium]|jgi:HlyD family secretion protein|nr:efflux RND transporter periplasmic adaptor subunit [Holosporales bacterium]
MKRVGVLWCACVAAALCVALIVFKCWFCASDEIILNGNVEIHDVNVAFRVPGKIGEILVDEGSEVKEGEVLARLVSDTFSAKVKLAKAQLAEAETILINTKKNYVRFKSLMKNKSASEKAYDTAEAEYKAASAKVEAAKAAYEVAIIDLQDSELKSPVNGVILTRNFECSEMTSASTPVFSIMPYDHKQMIKVFANELALARIRPGGGVYVTITSMPDKKFKGHIGFISREAEFTPKNIETSELRADLVYRIRVIVDEPAPELKYGMPATVKVLNN